MPKFLIETWEKEKDSCQLAPYISRSILASLSIDLDQQENYMTMKCLASILIEEINSCIVDGVATHRAKLSSFGILRLYLAFASFHCAYISYMLNLFSDSSFSRLEMFGYLLLCFLAPFSLLIADSEFDSTLEQPTLQNIRQLTFTEMGFEKCGEAYFSPDASKIIFQAVPTGQAQYQIYTMSLDESIPRMVSTGYGACTCAYFRPDGIKIIFASSHSDPDLLSEEEQSIPGYQREGGTYLWAFTPYMNIYEADPDGSHLTPLTFGPAYHAECAYSPDGQRIVYACNESGSMNLYTMRSDGTDVHQITYTQNSYNGGPFFSPDGQKIIFRADREKPHYLDIFCIDINGANERKLTSNGAVNWAPYWHPSGHVIAYTTSLHGHQHYEIYLMNIDTKVHFRLTHNATFDGLPVFTGLLTSCGLRPTTCQKSNKK